MKETKVTVIPDCDLCKAAGAGVYDRPVESIGGSWANVCEICNKKLETPVTGTKRVMITISKPSEDNDLYEANDIADLADVLADECNRELECPKCGETHEVEVDFSGEYRCTGCGRRMHAGPLI